MQILIWNHVCAFVVEKNGKKIISWEQWEFMLRYYENNGTYCQKVIHFPVMAKFSFKCDCTSCGTYNFSWARKKY